MDGTLDRRVGHPTSPFDFLPVCTGVQLHQGLLWLLRLTAHNWKPQTAGPRLGAVSYLGGRGERVVRSQCAVSGDGTGNLNLTQEPQGPWKGLRA